MRLFLFPGIKGQMKGKRSADVGEVKKKTLEVLSNISTEEFQKCFSSEKNVGTMYRVGTAVSSWYSCF